MKRFLTIRNLVLLLVLTVAAMPAIHAQQKTNGSGASPAANQPGAQSKVRTYAPRVIGNSTSRILEGRIVEIRDNRISILARGSRYDFRIDDQTTVFDSDEIVSIATMNDMALNVSDLRVSDWVEVVAEGAGSHRAAKIITRVSGSDAPIARRSGKN